MGLYNYSGTLLINSQPARNYTRESLHAHTTVCFQDYAKYNLTLRENVGTGNYLRMEDEELLEDALKKGGADAVVAKLPNGVDEELDKFWTPARGEEVGSLPPPPPGKKKGGKVITLPPTAPPVARPPGTVPPPNRTAPPPSSVPAGGRMAGRMRRMRMRDAKSLSGGQWQRVALARAFMRSDESTLR